jgi:hypothetical protein
MRLCQNLEGVLVVRRQAPLSVGRNTSLRPATRTSSIAKRYDWIDPDRSARGDVTRRESDSRKHSRDDAEGKRIGRGYTAQAVR